MPPIITITFSPCIDKSASVSELIPEKKLRCSSLKFEPGGGGINVARAIKKLGGEAVAIYPSGGYTGKFFDHLLEKENLEKIIIDIGKETRENIIILEEISNQQYRFGMPGTALSENEWLQCLHVVEKIQGIEYIVASGSLPPGVPMDIYARLSIIAKKKNVKLIVDASGDTLKYVANEGIYMLKPNLGELSSLLGIIEIDINQIEILAKQAIARNYCEVILVSMGENGAVLATKNEFYWAIPPPVNIKSVVGAGDSMVAGMVYAISQNTKLKDALKYAVACGTAATLNPGTELCRKNDVELLLKKILLK